MIFGQEALSYPDWHKAACGTKGGGYGNHSCPNFSIDKPMPPALARTHRRAYFASLSYTDELLGNVVAALDAIALKDNTVVMMWADHGADAARLRATPLPCGHDTVSWA